jgi:thioredoxin-like negative regulator of GroEL
MNGRDLPGLADPGDPPERDSASILEHDLLDRVSGSAAVNGPAAKAARRVQQARTLYEAGDLPGAVGLLDEAITADPTFLPAWLWKARCLVRSRNLRGAIDTLTRGRTQVRGAEAVADVDTMIDACRRHLTDPSIKESRAALRAGQPAAALALLEECAAALAGDETFEARRTYARERVRDITSPGPTQLTHARLQEVLAWLCREEMADGRNAFGAEDFESAAVWFGRARKRDGRNTEAALEEAKAFLCISWSQADTRSHSWAERLANLKRAARLLDRADELAREAERNRAIADEAASVREQIAADRRTLDEWTAPATKHVAVNACIEKYNALCRHLDRNRNDPLATVAFITSFPPIEAKAKALLERYGADDPDIGSTLVELVAAVGRTRRGIHW